MYFLKIVHIWLAARVCITNVNSKYWGEEKVLTKNGFEQI